MEGIDGPDESSGSMSVIARNGGEIGRQWMRRRGGCRSQGWSEQALPKLDDLCAIRLRNCRNACIPGWVAGGGWVCYAKFLINVDENQFPGFLRPPPPALPVSSSK